MAIVANKAANSGAQTRGLMCCHLASYAIYCAISYLQIARTHAYCILNM